MQWTVAKLQSLWVVTSSKMPDDDIDCHLSFLNWYQIGQETSAALATAGTSDIEMECAKVFIWGKLRVHMK